MNYGLQKHKLEKLFSKKGIDSDKIDLFSRIDRKLSYNENKHIINKKIGYGNAAPIKGRISSFELTEKAREYYDTRKSKSRRNDDRLRARNTFFPDSITKKEFEKWRKHPNRYDIEGVDTRGGY